MYCTRLAENTGRKKSPSQHHHTNLSGCIFAIKACIDNRKKSVKQQYLLHMPHNMANFRPLAAEIGSGVWGTPANFNGFRVLASTQRRRWLEANQTARCLAVSWAGTPYIHRESKKGCHPNHGYNFVNSWWICKILSLLERPVNLQQNQ